MAKTATHITVDGERYDLQDAELAQDVSDLKSAVDDLGAVSVEAFPLTIGHMTDTGKWGQLSAGSYKHFVFTVTPGDEIGFKCTVKNTVVGFVTDYSLPLTSSTDVLYSAEAGFTSKITITSNTLYTWTVPADAKYIIVEKVFGSADVGISVFSINGYNRASALDTQIAKLNTQISELENQIFDVVLLPNLAWEKGAINQTTGENATSSFRIRTAEFTPFINGVSFTIPEEMEISLIEYDSNGSRINTSDLRQSSFVAYPSQAGSKFKLFGGYIDKRTTITAGDSALYSIGYVKTDDNAPVWYALGDSITQGFYSETWEGGIAGRTPMGYPTYAALANKWKLVNYGVGGSGYIKPSDSLRKPNAKGQVDLIDFAGCDICTLAFGVNDWHYNQEIGTVDDAKTLGTTMASNMKYVIEKILTDNPLCRLNIMLPMNCATYGGDFESDWGLNTSLQTSGTLQHVIDVIKAVAEMYHLPVIDQSKTGIANRFNILEVLPDGIHPALETMKVYGERIARQIM